MGERRYRISFEIDAGVLFNGIKARFPYDYWDMCGAFVGNPNSFPLTVLRAITRDSKDRWVSQNAVSGMLTNIEIKLQDEAPKQSEGAGQSCGQSDDGQVLNQLGDTSYKICSAYKAQEELDLYKDRIKEVGGINLKHAKKLAQFRHGKCHTLPKPCPICGKCNKEDKPACQSDEKEHPGDFCMFCGGELIHCDNSLWDGVWVHSVCIPY